MQTQRLWLLFETGEPQPVLARLSEQVAVSSSREKSSIEDNGARRDSHLSIVTQVAALDGRAGTTTEATIRARIVRMWKPTSLFALMV